MYVRRVDFLHWSNVVNGSDRVGVYHCLKPLVDFERLLPLHYEWKCIQIFSGKCIGECIKFVW